MDDGDPRKSVPHRDRVLNLAAPFDSAPVELTKTEQRCTGIQWGETDGLALVWDYDRDRRWTRTFRINTERLDSTPTLMWERSVNDRYADPGTPMHRLLPNGQSVIWQHDTYLYLRSAGATPKGDRPSLDRYNLATGETIRLFSCDDQSYETVVVLLTDDATQFLTQRESQIDPPNVYLHAAGRERRVLTDFPDPRPGAIFIRNLLPMNVATACHFHLRCICRRGTRKAHRFPPSCGLIRENSMTRQRPVRFLVLTNRFTSLNGISHLFLLTQSYAILDEATSNMLNSRTT